VHVDQFQKKFSTILYCIRKAIRELNRKRQKAFRERNKDKSEHQKKLHQKRQKTYQEQNKQKIHEYQYLYYQTKKNYKMKNHSGTMLIKRI
jgi:predicted methyltransferase